jgi:hypothetical protein
MSVIPLLLGFDRTNRTIKPLVRSTVSATAYRPQSRFYSFRPRDCFVPLDVANSTAKTPYSDRYWINVRRGTNLWQGQTLGLRLPVGRLLFEARFHHGDSSLAAVSSAILI